MERSLFNNANIKSNKPKQLLWLVLFCFVLLSTNKAQNLVPNPSFEEFNYNDNYLDNLPGAPKNWSSLYSASWFHTDNTPPPSGFNYGTGVPDNWWGFQYPHTGLGYAGFYGYLKFTPSFRETPYVALIDSLQINRLYCVSFYVSLADTAVFAHSLLSALFLKDTMSLYNAYNTDANTWTAQFTPQVTNSSGFLANKFYWQKVEGSFVADSAYKYIVLGEFSNITYHDTLRVPGGHESAPNPYSFYYIDDVSVTEIKDANAGSDTVLLNGPDTVYLGQNFDDNAFYEWWPHTGIADTNQANPIAFVEQNTTYYVKKTQCNVVSYDTIVVTVIPNSIKENETYSGFTISPNPNKGNFVIKNTNNKNISGTLEIYNTYGELIQKDKVQTTKDIEVEMKTKTPGIYFVKLINENNQLLYLGKVIVQ